MNYRTTCNLFEKSPKQTMDDATRGNIHRRLEECPESGTSVELKRTAHQLPTLTNTAAIADSHRIHFSIRGRLHRLFNETKPPGFRFRYSGLWRPR